jgi:hypothetical protein
MPALDALFGTEHSVVLTGLLGAHPELWPEAEEAARTLLASVAVDAVSSSLEAIPNE